MRKQSLKLQTCEWAISVSSISEQSTLLSLFTLRLRTCTDHFSAIDLTSSISKSKSATPESEH